MDTLGVLQNLFVAKARSVIIGILMSGSAESTIVATVAGRGLIDLSGP
jgi:hypothetical protein